MDGLAEKMSKFRQEEGAEMAQDAVDSLAKSLPPNMRVVAFDQSLAHTGWCWIVTSAAGVPEVAETGMIETVTNGNEDYEDSFQRGVTLFHRYLELLLRISPNLVAHEMPAIIGGRMAASKNAKKGREGNLIACTALRCAHSIYEGQTGRLIPLDMLNNQHIKKVLTGDARAEKAAVREAVRKLYRLDGRGLRLNENTYDSMGVGTVALYDMRKKVG